MKKFRIISAFILALLIQTPMFGAVNNTIINANNFVKLISNTSQYVRIQGKIYNSEITDKSKVIFLNFGKNFNTSLSAVIYDINVPSFIDAGINEPGKYFNNKKVVIEGVIRISDGKPEILISSPNQIKVIEN